MGDHDELFFIEAIDSQPTINIGKLFWIDTILLSLLCIKDAVIIPLEQWFTNYYFWFDFYKMKTENTCNDY